MQVEFHLPALGADMDAGTVVEWRVGPGDRCKRGDVVAVVETDKGAIDVEIFIDGVVRELLVPTGTRVPVGTALARLETEAGLHDTGAHTGEAAPADEALPAPSLPPAGAGAGQRARISPAARKRALELHVDATSLRGTGPEGSITVADIERATSSSQPSPAVLAKKALACARRSQRRCPAPSARFLITTSPRGRRDARQRLARGPQRSGAGDGAVAAGGIAGEGRGAGLPRPPGFQWLLSRRSIRAGPVVHVGVAVALRGGGLVAPAIMDTASRPLAALMNDFRDLVARARAGRLRASETSAPTIILTSLGEADVETVLPIIQPPQVAIVGAGAVVERPWVIDGKVAPRRVLTLSLGADHRVTDGRMGAHFLARIAALLAEPAQL